MYEVAARILTLVTDKVLGVFLASCLLLGSVAMAQPADGSLTISPPTGWKVEYHGKPDYCYIITKDTDTLMLTPLLVEMKPEQLPAYLQDLAEKFIKSSKGDPRFQSDSKPYIEGQYAGTVFSGHFVLFGNEDDNKQVMIAFYGGGKLWRGVYTGSSDGWSQALETLKTVK